MTKNIFQNYYYYIDTRYVHSMIGIHTSLNVALSINALKYHQFLDMQNDQINISTNYYYLYIPYLGFHNAHPLLALKISRKKLVRVYNAHGLLKKIVVRNVRIKYQSYIFFSPLSMFHLLGEFKNHLSLFIFNKVAKY